MGGFFQSHCLFFKLGNLNDMATALVLLLKPTTASCLLVVCTQDFLGWVGRLVADPLGSLKTTPPWRTCPVLGALLELF